MIKRFKWLISYTISCLLSIIKNLFKQKTWNSGDDIVVIGNWPSFKDSIDQDKDLFKWKDLLVVNNFVTTDYFLSLRPKYYLVADSAFFETNEKWSGELNDLNNKRIKNIQKNFTNWLINKVNWNMTLFIPLHLDISKFKKLLEKNKYIKIERYIMNPININISWLRNLLYKFNFWMPTAQNVLIAAIYIALNMNYKNIYLVWGDHSRFEDYYIDENNVLYSMDKHFYENKQKMVPLMNNWKPSKIHEELYFLYKAFKWHVLLESYSKYLGSHIINASKKSYIDAYDRLK